MGSQNSKSMSPEDISELILSRGSIYKPYADSVIEYGICGECIEAQEDFNMIMNNLNITNEIHRHVMSIIWKKVTLEKEENLEKWKKEERPIKKIKIENPDEKLTSVVKREETNLDPVVIDLTLPLSSRVNPIDLMSDSDDDNLSVSSIDRFNFNRLVGDHDLSKSFRNNEFGLQKSDRDEDEDTEDPVPSHLKPERYGPEEKWPDGSLKMFVNVSDNDIETKKKFQKKQSISKLVEKGTIDISALVEVRKINDPDHKCHNQYGLFAKKPIKLGTVIGHYTGVVKEVKVKRIPYKKEYEFTVMKAANGTAHVIDPRWMGSHTRFINSYKNVHKQRKSHNCKYEPQHSNQFDKIGRAHV